MSESPENACFSRVTDHNDNILTPIRQITDNQLTRKPGKRRREAKKNNYT